MKKIVTSIVFGSYIPNGRDTYVYSDGSIAVYGYGTSLDYNAESVVVYDSWEDYSAKENAWDRDIPSEKMYNLAVQARSGLLGYFPPKKLIIHGGMFHLDDLAVSALCRIANPFVQIERVNKPDLEKTGSRFGTLVADVGGICDPERWLFDHHQDRYDPATADCENVRAAVGRVWDALGDSQAYPTLTAWIRAVDLHDTGVNWTPLGVFGAFAPNWDDTTTIDEGFYEALDIVQQIIVKMIEKDEAAARAADALEELPQEHGILRMDEAFIPWQDWVKTQPDIKAVVHPGRDVGTWNLSIPRGRGKFPDSWLENKPAHTVFVANWLTMVTVDDREVIDDLVNQIINEDQGASAP